MKKMANNRNAASRLFIILGISALLFVIPTVDAQISVDVEPGPSTIYVNQQLTFTANATGGTPPYSYQWYTQLWSRDPNQPAPQNPQGDLTTVPDANTSSFIFTSNSPGWYTISIMTNDSANHSVFHSFPPAGLWVKVISPSKTTSPASTTPSATVPEYPCIMVLSLLLTSMLIAKLAKRKSNNS